MFYSFAIVVFLSACYTSGLSANVLPALDNFTEVYPIVNKLGDSSVTPLYFGLMIASPAEDGINSNTTVSAVQLALDTINTNSDLLSGYSLHYTLTFSECSETDLADKTVSQLFGTPGVCKLGLIEVGCTASSASAIRTNLVEQFNIPQITCSPTIREKSFRAFEISPASDFLVPALVEAIVYYNWTRLALLVENKKEYSEISEALKKLNVTLTVTSLSLENHTLKVEDSCDNNLFGLETRIYLLAMSSEVAKHLICEAFKADIKYPKYEFILVSGHGSDWWVGSPQDDMHYGCSTEERADVLNYSLAFQWRPILSHNEIQAFSDRHALYCYDAVWTLALALNKTISDFAGSCIHNDRHLARELHEIIKATNFTGQTGRIEFVTNGRRIDHESEVIVWQYQSMTNGKRLSARAIGSYKNGSLILKNDTSLWPSGAPYDGSPAYVLVTVSVPLAVVYYLLATAGIILAIACCVFNFSFRKRKVVRLTSPNLNYLITTGVVFFYIGTYWYCLPSTDPNVILTACCIELLIIIESFALFTRVLIQLQAWFIALGFFIAMGTVVAKLWRIYYIFRNPDSTKKKIFTDCHLLVFILSVVAFNTVILLLFTVVEIGLPGYELNKISNKDYPSEIVGDQDVDTRYEFYTCTRVPYARTIFTGAIFITIGILMLCALFMAIKTRKIQIKGLNDAKEITMMVYISSFGAGVHLILNATLRSYMNTFPAVLMGFSMVMVTIVLSLVFIPKMISLYHDPDGEHIFSHEDTVTPNNFQPAQLYDVTTSTVISNTESPCAGCQLLQAKVKKLEKCFSQENLNSTLQGEQFLDK